MKITEAEFFYLDVPFNPHTNQHLEYWLPDRRMIQLCKLTLDNGVVGWVRPFPTIPGPKAPDEISERLIGRNAGRSAVAGRVRCRCTDGAL